MLCHCKRQKVELSVSIGERLKSKKDPCDVCEKRVMANSMLCTECGNGSHGGWPKIKRVTYNFSKGFIRVVYMRDVLR